MKKLTIAIIAALVGTASCSTPEDVEGRGTLGSGLRVLEPQQAEQAATVCGAGPTVAGIDVSQWQGSIDWDAVRASGRDFAITRIGDGLGHDPYFAFNWQRIKEVGMIRGAY